MEVTEGIPVTDAKRVLVVDDNETNRDVLARRLERQALRVTLAEDGVQALEWLRTGQFDLVLLDIMMPRMNGYEVLEKLRDDSTIPPVPVIVVSAVDELDSVVKCIELGAVDYLFKPFNPVLLKARVNAILRQATQTDLNALRSYLETINGHLEALIARGAVDTPEFAALTKMQDSTRQALSLINRRA